MCQQHKVSGTTEAFHAIPSLNAADTNSIV